MDQENSFSCEDFELDKIFRLDNQEACQSGYFTISKVYFNFKYPPIKEPTTFERVRHNLSPDLDRYYRRRYFFFSRFDQGIKLDAQSWYSVIGEPIALYICQKLLAKGVKSVLEPFCGSGGFAVFAAKIFDNFSANDIDPIKISNLKNNLSVYGIHHSQLFISNMDAMQIKPYNVDAVVLCPPWGGSEMVDEYPKADLDQLFTPKLTEIIKLYRKFSRNMVIQLPKSTNILNLLKVLHRAKVVSIAKIQYVFLSRPSQLLVYIGDLDFIGIGQNVIENMINDLNQKITKVPQFKQLILKNIKAESPEIFELIYKAQNKSKQTYIQIND